MTEATTEHVVVTEAAGPGGWGRRLREQREARKWSVGDVAGRLHLPDRLIAAIEAEDDARLPDAIFVKGYLRSYARLVDIAPELVLDAYNIAHGGQVEPELKRVGSVSEDVESGTVSRLVTWAILAVIGVSVLVWVWSELSRPTVPEVAVVPELAAPTAPVPDEALVPLVPETLPAGPVSAAPTASTAPVAVVSAPAPTAPAAVAPTMPPAAPATIRLQLSGDSWIEIKDANGKVIFADLMRAGMSKTIEIVPPVNVLLGNAEAVTLEYNGAVFDHKPYLRQNMARFTLGK